MKKFAFLIAAPVLAAGFASAASAATIYTGTRSVGSASAQLSITTDDTIGVLTSGNVIDWTITLNEGGDVFTLFGPGSGNNSQLLVGGTALRATATELLFDFSAGGSQYALFQAPFIGSSTTFYCVQTDGCFDFGGAGEAIEAGSSFSYPREFRQGEIVLATAGAGSVPEPSAWALMILGFGMAGAAMRQRKARVRFA